MMKNNPITSLDYPDVDVIRVDDTYYMISTTMHFMPGGVILKSYDLIHWEFAAYLYDILEDTPEQRLEGNENIYGQGMWAASLRYHKGTFYACFVANDTHKTYCYESKSITGPWLKHNIEGFFHDCSLLFDDDGRTYIVSGNKEIHLTELNEDLTAPKENGLSRIIVTDNNNVCLGYEGSHMYKINGKYYIFFIHWPMEGAKRRTEACYVADSLDGEFTGKDVLDDDMGYCNSGIAQGGIVDTPEGDWYAVLFQDSGAVGRIPVLVPVHWENDFPVFGVDHKVPAFVNVKSTRPGHSYEPLVGSDAFDYDLDHFEKKYASCHKEGYYHLKPFWQWNHIPSDEHWAIHKGTPNALCITSNKISQNVCQAANTLTQRMTYPGCQGTVTVDGSMLKDGDYAGICVLQGEYGLIAMTRQKDEWYLVMLEKEETEEQSIWPDRHNILPGKEVARVKLDQPTAVLRVKADFTKMKDEAEFYYQQNNSFVQLGKTHKLHFRLDHFAGARFGLFVYSRIQVGGTGKFMDFRYETVSV